MNIAALILAAGISSRMGSDKALLEVNGEPALKHINNKITPFSENILAVAGANYAGLKIKLADVNIILNKNWQNGMFSSLQTGITALPENVSWLMVHLVDHPFILSATYKKLIDSLSSNLLVVKPRLISNMRSGHPIFISSQLFPFILKQSPDANLRRMVHTLPKENIKWINVNDSSITDNLNTFEQFDKKRKKYLESLYADKKN